MTLRDRLTRYDPLGGNRNAVGIRPKQGLDCSESNTHREPNDVDLCTALDLRLADGVWFRRNQPVGIPAPLWPLPDMRGILSGWVPNAGNDMRGWNDVLLLDVETTGLSRGTGTLVFLAGFGWWDDDGFHVHQVFLPGPQHEGAFLKALCDVAAGFRAVVTYNGAAFDLPLLGTRARLNRCASPCDGFLSWDLLAPARRLWGRRLPDCRQQTVELALCDYRRSMQDIGGDTIPSVYRSFLTEKTTDRMTRVLYHNQCDLEGLGLILAAVFWSAQAITKGPVCWSGPAQDAWSNALIGERRRERRTAAGWSAGLVARAMLSQLPVSGVLDAIRHLKRIADWKNVETAICESLGRWPDDPRLHYEAAVLYEHRLGDVHRAMRHALILKDERRLTRLRARQTRLSSRFFMNTPG